MNIAKNIMIHVDIESLDTGPKSVVTQIAFLAVDADDPDEGFRREAEEYLPVQPQQTLGRTISFDTILFWMAQDEKAKAKMALSRGNDMDELVANVQSIAYKLQAVIDDVKEMGGTYEIWARGPQFDVVNLETLFESCGAAIPWKYDTVRDLRTTMKLAGVATADVPMPAGLVAHHALSDCKYQLVCYGAAMRSLRARV